MNKFFTVATLVGSTSLFAMILVSHPADEAEMKQSVPELLPTAEGGAAATLPLGADKAPSGLPAKAISAKQNFAAKVTSTLPSSLSVASVNNRPIIVECSDCLFKSLSDYAVNQADSSQWQALEMAFRHKIETSPEFAVEVVNRYSMLSDGIEKGLLSALLYDVSVTMAGPAIDEIAAQALQLDINQNNTGLFELVERIGVRTAASRNGLLSLLPSLSDANSISSLIAAITPQATVADERQTVISQLLAYVNDQNEEIRSAAIRAVGSWGQGEYTNVIEQGLADHSSQVRQTSAAVAIEAGVQSEYLKQQLLSMMNNAQEDKYARLQAYFALTQYPLVGSERAAIEQFILEREALGV